MENEKTITITQDEYRALIKSDIAFDNLVYALMRSARLNYDGSDLCFDAKEVRFICETQLPEAYSARQASLTRKQKEEST